MKKTYFDRKLKHLNKKKDTPNKIKHLLVENEMKNLQIFGSTLFISQSYFNNNGTQTLLNISTTLLYFEKTS